MSPMSSLNTTITRPEPDYTFPEQMKTLTKLKFHNRRNLANIAKIERNNNPNSVMQEGDHSKWFSMYQD